MASARSSGTDLWERIWPGSPQDLLNRTCTISCKDLLERNSSGSPQDLLIRTCARSCKDLWEDFVAVCTISATSSHTDLDKTSVMIFIDRWDLQECSVKLWQDPSKQERGFVLREMREFIGKMEGPKTGQHFCVSLRNQNAHGHLTRCEPAPSKRTWASQKTIYARNYSKMPRSYPNKRGIWRFEEKIVLKEQRYLAPGAIVPCLTHLLRAKVPPVELEAVRLRFGSGSCSALPIAQLPVASEASLWLLCRPLALLFGLALLEELNWWASLKIPTPNKGR